MKTLFGETFINPQFSSPSMWNPFAKKTNKTNSDEVDQGRRTVLKGIAGATAYLTTGGLASTALADTLWDAKKTIWANYPEMQRAIDFSLGDEGAKLDHVLFSDYNYSGYPTPKRIPTADKQTPQYWLLLRVIKDNSQYEWSLNEGRGPIKDEKNRGIPIITDRGVRYFAEGLSGNISQQQREHYLLRALSIGIDGTETLAEDIINERYLSDKEAIAKLNSWKKENKIWTSEKWDPLSAYLSVKFSKDLKGKLINPELVSHSLLALTHNFEGVKDRLYKLAQNNAKRMGANKYFLTINIF